MVRKRYFVLLGNTHILVYYLLVPFQRIKFYRAETMDMLGFFWNNGVRGICNPSKYCVTCCTGLATLVGFLLCLMIKYLWHISDTSNYMLNIV